MSKNASILRQADFFDAELFPKNYKYTYIVYKKTSLFTHYKTQAF